MLTDRDDWLGHQTSDPYGKPAFEDTKSAIYTERYWYMGATVPDGNVIFGLGLGFYPNRGVMDCYAAVTVDGRQHSLQASRRTQSDPLVPAVGPIRIDILEGSGRHRLRVEPNASTLSLDLEFVGRMHPNDEGRDIARHRDRVLSDVRRFVQAGRFAGHVTAAGRRFEIDPRTSVGFRDRSWGLRAEARTDETTPPVSKFPAILYVFLCVQFETHSLHLFFKENAPGDFRFLSGDETGPIDGERPSGSRSIVHADHDLTWTPGAMSQEIEGGEIALSFRDGSSKLVHMRSLDRRLFLKGGLYGGLAGWFQGDDRGALHVGSTCWDLDDPADRRTARTLAEQLVEVRDGQAVGYGTIQCGVGPGYPKYEHVQALPAQ